MDLFTTAQLVEISFWVIGTAALIIVVSLIVLFLRSRKSIEEEKAERVLDTLGQLKEGKATQIVSAKEKSPSFEIKKEETSLKSMLIKKFKPKIEHQLNTKVSVLDFNAKEDKFLVLVEISGVKILLTLDSSGKIVDYKKVKNA